MTHQIAVVGVGPGREVDIGGKAHSFGYLHADAYSTRKDCEVVACADIVPEYGAKFADEFDIAEDAVYQSSTSMLAEVNPEVVSVCTPIPTHDDIVIDCASCESVKAVHCEKPMADSWSGARAMAHVCDREGIQLTFGHQRRFGDPFLTAKSLLDKNVVGELERIEISWGNFFDNGTHTLDLAAMFNDERRGTWIIGQIDCRKKHMRYGVPTADHAFMSWQYENGVHGVAATGDDVELTGGPYDFYDSWFRLICSEGVIEVGSRDRSRLEYRRDGEGWKRVEVEDEFAGRVDHAINDVIDALNHGRKSVLRAKNALKTTELLFAGHESSRRRARIDLPLQGVYDHPLEAMIESGQIAMEDGPETPG